MNELVPDVKLEELKSLILNSKEYLQEPHFFIREHQQSIQNVIISFIMNVSQGVKVPLSSDRQKTPKWF